MVVLRNLRSQTRRDIGCQGKAAHIVASVVHTPYPSLVKDLSQVRPEEGGVDGALEYLNDQLVLYLLVMEYTNYYRPD